jgi:hypothetical protein
MFWFLFPVHRITGACGRFGLYFLPSSVKFEIMTRALQGILPRKYWWVQLPSIALIIATIVVTGSSVCKDRAIGCAEFVSIGWFRNQEDSILSNELEKSE